MKTVLVVDDSTVDRQLAAQLLRHGCGFEAEHASNGIEALELMEDHLPLAVVTDLQMPEMDGYQLVERIRKQYPTVPVVVMTAVGSEEIALQALLAGAADYVPKSRLGSDLAKAVKAVLSAQDVDHAHGQLSDCLRYHEFRYQLENDVVLVAPLSQQLQRAALEMHLVDEADGLRMARAVAEALRNAICHGNLEMPPEMLAQWDGRHGDSDDPVLQRASEAPFRDRRVQVEAIITAADARITVRDQGRGFDPATLPDYRHTPAHLIEGGGRGLALISVFMDEVTFADQGRTIVMVKRKRR